MPREQINYPGAWYEADAKTGESKLVAPADPAVHVAWTPNPGCHVQLAIEADPGAMTERAQSAEGDDRAFIYSPNLERQELNKLIRVLRRARDQAYGKDE